MTASRADHTADLGSSLERASLLYQALLGRDLDEPARQSLSNRVRDGTFDEFALALQLAYSSEFLGRLCERAIDAHLYLIHRARQLMIRRLLPAAAHVLDLGGANAPLYRMGYAHPFRRLVMVDLPPEARHEMYRQIAVAPPHDGGEVVIHYCDMTRLDAFDDATFDLVWSGQSIEHVDLASGGRMCREALRVLKPGGAFCLDTPNRGVTRIHMKDLGGGLIHPEHKHEYHAHELRELLVQSGFEVAAARGVCEMAVTRATGEFHYPDFVLGNPLVDDPEAGYILYFGCRKPA